MNYNRSMKLLLAALLLAAGPVFAEDKKDEPAPADKQTVELVQYFLKVPTEDASPKLIDPFLAVKSETLPKKLRNKTVAKQAEIGALLRLHDTKKGGTYIHHAEGCSEKDFVKPLTLSGFFGPPAYAEVTEDEIQYVQTNTHCTELDLGCRFSLLIFFEKKRPRVIKFLAADPIMAIVAQSHGGGTGSHLFGSGLTCEHD
jgi:hypothetical protein